MLYKHLNFLISLVALSSSLPYHIDEHLYPIHPFADKVTFEYQELVHKLFGIENSYNTTLMMYRPSFAPEEVVIIKQNETDDLKFDVIYKRSTKNIWFSIAENKQKDIVIITAKTTISSIYAKRIFNLWEKAISDVKYRPFSDDAMFPGAFDGTTVEFWRDGRYGEVHDPELGVPIYLTNLGRSLMHHCNAQDPEKIKTLKVVEDDCITLENYYKAHDKKK